MTSRGTVDLLRLSKTLAHALRHEPWLYEIELDDEGRASLEVVLRTIADTTPELAAVTRADVERLIATADKSRYELLGDRIRAFYGHSIPRRLVHTTGTPPATLYHGTSRAATELILKTGLQPMGRQYVHLSIDRQTAEQVGKRKDPNPIVLAIDAAGAHTAGVAFYHGNEKVWLVDAMCSSFIAVANAHTPR